MRSFPRSCSVIAVIAAAVLAFAGPAGATSVDLELSLLIDVSGSVDGSEFNTQRAGYSAAFRDASVIDRALNQTQLGAMAVNVVYWSTSAVETIGWTVLDSEQDFLDFADAIDAAARPGNVGTQTGIANALTFATPLFASNGIDGTRQVMDVSGDGTENVASSSAVAAARDAALAAGVDTINGLVIEEGGVETFYNTYVIGGTLPMLLVVDSFDDFQPAVLEKIKKEVGPPIPEPLTCLGLLMGLGTLAGTIRRRLAH